MSAEPGTTSGDVGPPDESDVLVADGLSLSFGGVQALNSVSLRIPPRTSVGILGPNGAGKTSLLNCLNGFYRAQTGRISYAGRDLSRMAPHKIAGLGIARTFQGTELVPGTTVLQSLLVGRHNHMRGGVLSGMIYWGRALAEEVREREAVERVIEFLEIERLRDREVSALSAGQQRLVGLGRALAAEPKILLLDEPSAGMNREERNDVARFMQRIRHETQTSQVLIEHDVRFVRDLCEYVYVLDFGRVIAEGTPAEVLANEAVVAAYTGVVAG
jgi:branched-chain amino acid transport system ATP-binding protein